MKHVFPDYSLSYVDRKEDDEVRRYYKFLTNVRIERNGKYYYVFLVRELHRVSETDIDAALFFVKRCVLECYNVIHLYKVTDDIECVDNYSEADRLTK